MKPFGVWFGRLAMAGACLFLAGCGGGDVPDPDSDSRAASSESARPGPKPPPAPEEKPEPTALASNTSPAAPEEPAKPAPEPKVETPPEKPAEPPATKGDSSGTDDMLKMADPRSSPGTKPGDPAPSTPPATGPQPAPGGSAPPPSFSGPPPAPGGPAPQTNPGSPAPAPVPGVVPPASPASPPAEQPPRMSEPDRGGRSEMGNGGRPGLSRGEGGAPGGPGVMAGAERGAYGASGNNSDPTANMGAAAYNNPRTAVMAFLAALKAKDKDRLSQSVAKRAPTEAEEKHRKIFAAIIEQSISDDELDEIAKALDGYQFSAQMPSTSTGRAKIVVSKRGDGRDVLTAVLITRKEKEGWKVMDIEKMYEFKNPVIMRGRTGGRRR